MSNNALPLILAAGAAVVLLGGKKKKRRSAPVDEYVPADIPPPPPPPAKASSGASASKEVWKQRQTALAYLGGLGICDCNPGLPDGIYGKNTRNAILAFQKWVNIGQTGEWDAPTDTKMKEALVMAAKGLIKVPKVKPAPAPEIPNGQIGDWDADDWDAGDWDSTNVLKFLPRNVWRVNTEGIVGKVAHGFETARYYPKTGDRYAEIVVWLSGRDKWDDVLTALRTITIERPEVMFSIVLAYPTKKDDFGHARFDLKEQFPDQRKRIEYYHLRFTPEEMVAKLPDAISTYILGYVTWLTGERKSLKA